VTGFHEDRYFDPDPTIRRNARGLYDETRALPIVSPHGHVDPGILAKNDAFTDPASLVVTPDHYILRMLYSRGVPLESLGIVAIDGKPQAAETDSRKIWQTFADYWHLFRATPTRAWLEYELREVFGVAQDLDSASAPRIYDAIVERLQSSEFRPRALLDRFNIEVLATTDAASDTLEHHKTLRGLKLATRVIPTFRPDGLFRIAATGWSEELARFERVVGGPIRDYAALVTALARRRAEFKALGATATDHAVVVPRTERLADTEAGYLFTKAQEGVATRDDQVRDLAGLERAQLVRYAQNLCGPDRERSHRVVMRQAVINSLAGVYQQVRNVSQRAGLKSEAYMCQRQLPCSFLSLNAFTKESQRFGICFRERGGGASRQIKRK